MGTVAERVKRPTHDTASQRSALTNYCTADAYNAPGETNQRPRRAALVLAEPYGTCRSAVHLMQAVAKR